MSRADRRDRADKRQPTRKDLSIWDRFTNFVRVNEKVLIVILLLLIAPAFAFTSATATFLDRMGGKSEVLRVFGERVYSDETEEIQAILNTVHAMRGGAFARDRGTGVIDFLLCEREADRLGVVVSDEELGAQIRSLYQVRRASEDYETFTANNPTPPGQQPDQGYFMRRLEELRAANAWNQREWVRMLQEIRNSNIVTHPRMFEIMLRRYLRAEKVVFDALQGVQVSENAVLEAFRREHESRKATFFEVGSTAEIDAAAEDGITDADLDDYWDKNRESFNEYFSRLGLEWVYIPFAHFEDKVVVTEEEIQKAYESAREVKYRRGLVSAGEESFTLRTPEEEAALRAQLYKPLAEVRDEVIADLKVTKKAELARDFAAEIKLRVFGMTTSEGTVTGQADLDVMKSELPFLEVGRTKLMSSWEADKEIGKGNTARLRSLFQTLDSNAREDDVSKRRPLNVPDSFLEASDGSGLVFYRNVRTRYPGLPDRSEATEEIRERLVKERKLAKIEERARALAAEIRDGKKTFDAVAAEIGAKAHTTDFLERGGSIQLPVEKDPSDSVPADPVPAEGEDAAPKTEYFPGSSAVIQEVFGIDVAGDAGAGVARDAARTVCYIVRQDATKSAAESGYAAARNDVYDELLRERQNFHELAWRKRLWARADVQMVSAAAE